MKIFRLISLVVALIVARLTWGFSPDYQGHGTPIYRADKGLITDFDVTTSGVITLSVSGELLRSILCGASSDYAFAPVSLPSDVRSAPAVLYPESSVGCWSPVGDGLFAAFWDGRILLTSEAGEVRSVAQLPRELTGFPDNIQTCLAVDPLGRTVAIYVDEWLILDARSLELLGRMDPQIDRKTSSWTLVDRTLYYQRRSVRADGTPLLETIKEEIGSAPTIVSSHPDGGLPIAFFPAANGLLSLSNWTMLTYSDSQSSATSFEPPVGDRATWMDFRIDPSLTAACTLYQGAGATGYVVIASPDGRACRLTARRLVPDDASEMLELLALDRGAKRACFGGSGRLYLLHVADGAFRRITVDFSSSHLEARFMNSGALAVLPQWMSSHSSIRPSSEILIVDESGATVRSIDLPKLRATTTITPRILP